MRPLMLIILLVNLQQILLSFGDEAIPITLYKPDDPLLQLNNTNYETILFRGKSAHLVEFYLSWCGHCRRFAPTYVNFANDVSNWKDVVRIAAINCALKENDNFCKINKIDEVPALKYFPRNATTSNDSSFVQLVYQNVPEVRRGLIDKIAAEYKTNNYENWPNFNYLDDTLLKDVWNSVPNTKEYLALIIESEYDNYTGAELLLDLSSLKWLQSRRVDFSNSLVEELGVVDLPSLVVLRRNAQRPLYKSEMRRTLLTEVLKLGPSGGANLAFLLTTLPPTATVSTSTIPPEVLQSKYYVSETDLLLSIWFALDNEVAFDRDEISGNNFTALKNFIYVLKKYFPQSKEVRDTLRMLNLQVPQHNFTRSDQARKMFSDLYDNLNNRSNSIISVPEWKQLMNNFEAKHNHPFPTNADWQHCKGSEPKYRGYTCGLWSNFHTLTVNAFLEDSFKPNYDPIFVLQAIKGYVGHFFGCTECAAHFQDMVTRELPMEDWVHYASDTVMYLWRAHNHVNKRLAGDVTEDPLMPKRQFPAPFLCDGCQDVNGAWDSRVALRFLLSYYTSIRPHVELSRPVNTEEPKPKVVFNNIMRSN